MILIAYVVLNVVAALAIWDVKRLDLLPKVERSNFKCTEKGWQGRIMWL